MDPETLIEIEQLIDDADLAGRSWADAILGIEIDGWTLRPDPTYPGWENGRYVTTGTNLDGDAYDVLSGGGRGLQARPVTERETGVDDESTR